MEQTLSEQATQALEWPRVLDYLAQQAQSVLGSARCRVLVLSNELDVARRRQQETTEMVRLVEGSDPPPGLVFPDIREQLIRAEKGGVLDVSELRDCAITLALMVELERYAQMHQEEIQALAQVFEPLHLTKGLRSLQQAIEDAIQPDGAMKDTASPELRRLTHQAQGLKQEMREQLEQILHSRRYEDVLQESYFAQREGRYVVPVKVEIGRAHV